MVAAASSAQAYVETTPENMVPSLSVISAQNISIQTHQPSSNRIIIRLAQKKISASKAKKIARSQVRKGEVVDISLRKNTYKVRLIAKNGRVVDVLIDARTGRIK